jgi:hypothetical protein
VRPASISFRSESPLTVVVIEFAVVNNTVPPKLPLGAPGVNGVGTGGEIENDADGLLCGAGPVNVRERGDRPQPGERDRIGHHASGRVEGAGEVSRSLPTAWQPDARRRR